MRGIRINLELELEVDATAYEAEWSGHTSYPCGDAERLACARCCMLCVLGAGCELAYACLMIVGVI